MSKRSFTAGNSDVVCVLVDCKGVVMRRNHPEERHPIKILKKRQKEMATVGTVIT